MGWDNLPQEVLLKILQEVEVTYFNGLLECQLTCRAWKQLSQRLFYSTLELQNLADAYKALNTITANHINNVVKKVSFKSALAQSPRIEQFLPLFFSACPYITSIESCNTKDESFWTKLLRECYKDTLTKVEKLPMADFNRDPGIKIYGYVAMELCNNLTTVQIWDWPKSEPSFQHSQVASNLHKFPRLKRLYAYVSGIFNAAKIAFLIQDCKELEYLSITNHSDRRVLYSLMGARDQELPIPKPVIGIKSIDTNMVTVTENLLNQLIHVFPNLNSLKLNPTNESDFGPESDLDEELSFFFRMQMEGCSISPGVWSQFLSHVYKNIDYFELSVLFLPKMDEIVSDLIQTPKFKDHDGMLKIIYVHCSNFIELIPFVGISSPENLVKVIYDIRNAANINTLGPDDFILPHMELVESVGSKVKTLHISIQPASHFGDDDSPLFLFASGYFMDHIFKHCTELTTLTVSSAHLINFDPDYTANTSITTLRLVECLLCPGTLLQLSQRLPSLSDLVVCYTYFVSTSGQILQTKKSISIDVPYTTLNTLSIECGDRIYGDCNQFHLKIKKQDQLAVYYVGEGPTKFVKSTEAIYQESLDYRTSLSVEVNCIDIKSMLLEALSFSIDIQFKNNNDFKFRFED